MIVTDRLNLRDWRGEDRDPFIEATNRPEVMRWLGGVQSEAVMRDVVERLTRWQKERGFTFWLVERRADLLPLGFCGIKIADTPGSPIEGMHEIGWRLRPEAWGQGFAREAAEASLHFAFETLKAPIIVAITFIQNEPSWRLMERLGMRRRTDLDYDEPRFPDLSPAIVYSISSEEWRR